MTDEGKQSTTAKDQQTSADDRGAEKTFTQSDLDRIVSQRVNETKAKFEGFDAFREKAQIFDNMMDDDRFQRFVTNLEKQEDIDPASIKGMDDLKRYDPDIASAVEKIIEDVRTQDKQVFEKEIKRYLEPVEKELTSQKASRAVDEVEAMRRNVERYPYMQSKDFEGHMASLLTTPRPQEPLGPDNMPRAFGLEDAYDLAAVHFQREGKELPTAPSQAKKAKQDAELLEGRAGGGAVDVTADEPPPKFKNAREAAEWAMKKRGWL